MYEPSSETVYSDGCAQNILLPTQILFYGIPSIMFIRWEHNITNLMIMMMIMMQPGVCLHSLRQRVLG